MKFIHTIPAILAPAVLLLAASSSASAAPADLYKAKCAMCHAADGSGNTPMGKKLEISDLRAPATQGQPDAKLVAAVENGKGKMPSQKSRVSSDEIKQLVGYIRELKKK